MTILENLLVSKVDNWSPNASKLQNIQNTVFSEHEYLYEDPLADEGPNYGQSDARRQDRSPNEKESPNSRIGL